MNNFIIFAVFFLATAPHNGSDHSAPSVRAPSHLTKGRRLLAADKNIGDFDQNALVHRTLESGSDNPVTFMGGLGIPPGEATPLPSILVEESEEVKKKRAIYGGKGDKQHLGG